MVDLWTANEVEDFAKVVIANRLPELVAAKIQYLFKEKCSKSAGKLIIGDTKKATPKENFLAGGCDYVLVIGEDGWKDLSPKEREASVHRLLCFCFVDVDEETNDYIYKLKKPDIQEFTENVRVYGLWTEGLQDFGKSIKTVNFDESIPSPTVDGNPIPVPSTDNVDDNVDADAVNLLDEG